MMSFPNSSDLSPLDYQVYMETMLESYHKLQQKPKTIPELKNALHLIWSALPEKAIDNCERLSQATAVTCISEQCTF